MVGKLGGMSRPQNNAKPLSKAHPSQRLQGSQPQAPHWQAIMQRDAGYPVEGTPPTNTISGEPRSRKRLVPAVGLQPNNKRGRSWICEGGTQAGPKAKSRKRPPTDAQTQASCPPSSKRLQAYIERGLVPSNAQAYLISNSSQNVFLSGALGSSSSRM